MKELEGSTYLVALCILITIIASSWNIRDDIKELKEVTIEQSCNVDRSVD